MSKIIQAKWVNSIKAKLIIPNHSQLQYHISKSTVETNYVIQAAKTGNDKINKYDVLKRLQGNNE